jgi:hypothetical protein
MLEIRQYTTDELIEALEISKDTFKVHKAKYMAPYTYEEVKNGRGKSYKITGYAEEQKSPFIQSIEAIAGGQVRFSKEETAEKIIRYLMMKNRTLESSAHIAGALHMDEDTVNKYISKFREYGVLPHKYPIFPAILDEEGNVVQEKIDRNQYTYSILDSRTGKRIPIGRDEWRAYWIEFYEDVNNMYHNQILIEAGRRERKGLAPLKPGINKYFMDLAKANVRSSYIEMKGLAHKHISKQLTEKAMIILGNYYQQLAS